jgi:hypothetical protein
VSGRIRKENIKVLVENWLVRFGVSMKHRLKNEIHEF